MGDVLVLILLAVMMTAGMLMFFGGLPWLGFDAYRSMRRSRSSSEPQGPTSAEAEA